MPPKDVEIPVIGMMMDHPYAGAYARKFFESGALRRLTDFLSEWQEITGETEELGSALTLHELKSFQILRRTSRSRLKHEALTPLMAMLHAAKREMSVEHIIEQPSSASAESSRTETLEHENRELKLQVELLKSRVQEERRTAARETQRYDQLSAHHGELQQALEALAAEGRRKTDSNITLQRVLIAAHTGQLRMSERYEGVVKAVDGERVIVVYDVGEDLVEQTYSREQFLDGKAPAIGDRLVVCVHVAQVATDEEGNTEVDDARGPGNEQRRARRNVVSLPREF